MRAWDLLRDARETYERAVQRAGLHSNCASARTLASAYEALLAAEGSDWCWWYGPEHGSANDAEFDELYRKHLTEVYTALGEPVPDALAHPIKTRSRTRSPRTADILSRSDRRRPRDQLLRMARRGHCIPPIQRSGTMHGRSCVLGNLYYGFGRNIFTFAWIPCRSDGGNSGFSIAAHAVGFARNAHHSARGQRQVGTMRRGAGRRMLAASRPDGIGGIRQDYRGSLARELFDLRGRRQLLLSVALWEGGLPVEVLPVEGMLELVLGEENFAMGHGD